MMTAAHIGVARKCTGYVHPQGGEKNWGKVESAPPGGRVSAPPKQSNMF